MFFASAAYTVKTLLFLQSLRNIPVSMLWWIMKGFRVTFTANLANVRFKLRISQQETGNTWSRGTNSRLPFAANVTLGSKRELKQQRF